MRSGDLPFWQLNVLNPANYAPGAGRQVHRKIVISTVAAIAGFVAASLVFVLGTA